MDEQLRSCAVVVMKNTVALDDHPALSATMLKIRDVFCSGISKPEELIPMVELATALVATSDKHKRFFYNIRKPSGGDDSTRLIDLFCLSMFNVETPINIRLTYYGLFRSMFSNSEVLWMLQREF